MLNRDFYGTRPFRLALAFALAITLTTMAAFALIYFEVAREGESHIGVILIEISRTDVEASEAQLRIALNARLSSEIRRLDYLALFDARGALILGNVRQMPEIAEDGEAHLLTADAARTIGIAPEPAIFVARRRADGGAVLFGRNLQDIYDTENTLLRALGLALIPTVVIILVIGVLFARRASMRLSSIHSPITRIMEGDLESRLPAARDGDEIDRIASAVNLMLDEIARLLDQLKSVGDNIAHDLRAPLTLARIKLERALEAGPVETRVYLDAALAQLDRATVTIAAILRISAVENGPREKHFRDVDLAAVCEQTADFFEPVAEAKSVALKAALSGPLYVRGDEDLLREAIANVLDNAIKFTPPGGSVRLAASLIENCPCVEVCDTGPGVALADRELIFQRFHRAAGDGYSGYGLGLSIARTIAELHGFQLSVEDNAPGARFIMRAAAKASLTRASN